MKILFFDSMFPKGHKVINGRYLDILGKINADVYVCAKNGWFQLDDRFHIIDSNWIQPQQGKIKPRIQIMNNILEFLKVLKTVNPDVIYFASYDIVVLLFFVPWLYKYRKKIYIQEHNNVDQLDNRIKFVAYSVYKNMFHHLVFEKYIKDKLLSYGVRPDFVSVVPHPIPNAYERSLENQESLEELVVGLSNSNSETLVSDIVQEQEKRSFLSKTKLRMVLKARTIEYEDDRLKVISGWISNEDYSDYCKRSTYFLIPFPLKGYSYRVSGVFMEAVANGKKVIASRFPLVEYYAKAYPGICYIYDKVGEILSLLGEKNTEYSTSRLKFIEDHSDDTIAEAFCSAFRWRRR